MEKNSGIALGALKLGDTYTSNYTAYSITHGMHMQQCGTMKLVQLSVNISIFHHRRAVNRTTYCLYRIIIACYLELQILEVRSPLVDAFEQHSRLPHVHVRGRLIRIGFGLISFSGIQLQWNPPREVNSDVNVINLDPIRIQTSL